MINAQAGRPPSINKAVKKLKLVDPKGELARTARAVGIELGG